jgi:hypothetical protein
MSMFLIMLICITRTAALKCSHSVIKRKYLIGTITSYAAYMILTYSFFFTTEWYNAHYSKQISFCSLSIRVTSSSRDFVIITHMIEMSLPSLTAFICFLISIWVLKTRPALGTENDKKFRRVSVTITVFTAVFLVCNAPCFLFVIWTHGSRFTDILPRPIQVFSLRGTYYDELLLYFFPIFLNAVINPILYLLRMQGFRNWMRHILQN